MKKLLLTIPGTGFTCEEEIFKRYIEKYESLDYEVVKIDFSMIPFKEIETIPEAIVEANREIIYQTINLDFTLYDDIVIISKSLGTISAGWLEHFLRDLKVIVRQIYLTPIEETFSYVDPSSKVIKVVIGNLDSVFDYRKVIKLCSLFNIPYLVVDGVGHSLKRDNEEENKNIIEMILKDI